MRREEISKKVSELSKQINALWKEEVDLHMECVRISEEILRGTGRVRKVVYTGKKSDSGDVV